MKIFIQRRLDEQHYVWLGEKPEHEIFKPREFLYYLEADEFARDLAKELGLEYVEVPQETAIKMQDWK